MTSVTVVVPSYRRPAELQRCLDGVGRSSLRPDEVVVVLRPDDSAGRQVAVAAGARIVDVHQPGHLPPLIVALEAVVTDVMAVLDDDAVPHADWVERIARQMEDRQVVALGGPIDEGDASQTLPSDTERRLRAWKRGGRTWYRAFEGLPKAIDFRRLPADGTAPSDHLPGGNFAVRVEAMRRVGFDLVLNQGAAIGWESDVCLSLKKWGRVLFDPNLVVEHRPAPRRGAPPRDLRERYALDYTRNLFHIAAKHFPACDLLVFVPAMLLVGQRVSPGLVRTLVAATKGPAIPIRLAAHFCRARVQGWRTGLAARRSVAGPANPRSNGQYGH